MPGQDRTGPLGEGPMTGRRIGLCWKGQGFRRGIGRGFQTVVLTGDEEKKILESELSELEKEKQEIEKRLKELKI